MITMTQLSNDSQPSRNSLLAKPDGAAAADPVSSHFQRLSSRLKRLLQSLEFKSEAFGLGLSAPDKSNLAE